MARVITSRRQDEESRPNVNWARATGLMMASSQSASAFGRVPRKAGAAGPEPRSQGSTWGSRWSARESGWVDGLDDGGPAVSGSLQLEEAWEGAERVRERVEVEVETVGVERDSTVPAHAPCHLPGIRPSIDGWFAGGMYVVKTSPPWRELFAGTSNSAPLCPPGIDPLRMDQA
jgi:hypothetical protein